MVRAAAENQTCLGPPRQLMDTISPSFVSTLFGFPSQLANGEERHLLGRWSSRLENVQEEPGSPGRIEAGHRSTDVPLLSSKGSRKMG